MVMEQLVLSSLKEEAFVKAPFVLIIRNYFDSLYSFHNCVWFNFSTLRKEPKEVVPNTILVLILFFFLMALECIHDVSFFVENRCGLQRQNMMNQAPRSSTGNASKDAERVQEILIYNPYTRITINWLRKFHFLFFTIF